MKLAIAFGARGAGRARAHFEPARYVINLTKMNGAGSLAHEMGHALDFMIARRANISMGQYKFMSEITRLQSNSLKGSENVNEAFYQVMVQIRNYPETVQEGIDRYNSKRQSKIAEYNGCLKDLERFISSTDDLNENERKETLEAIQKDLDNPRISGESTALVDIMRAYRGRITQERHHWFRVTEVLRDIDRLTYQIESIKLDGQQSRWLNKESKFYMEAKRLDNGRKKRYYSEQYELFARAFESFIEDKLNSQGLKSEYLVHSTHNKLYGSLKPYPEGIEREAIDSKMEILMQAISKDYSDTLQDEELKNMYKNKEKHVDYRGAIREVYRSELKNGRPVSKPTEAQGTQGTQGTQGKPVAPVRNDNEINTVVELKEALTKGSGNNTVRGELSSADINKINKRIDVLAEAGKNALKYDSVGYMDYKSLKRQPMGISKAYCELATKKGGVGLVVDPKDKVAKQLEGLNEAMVRRMVASKYKPSTEAEMLTEGIMYKVCKADGLDVRTYCLGKEFEGLIRDKDRTKKFIELTDKFYNWFCQVTERK